MKNKKRGADGVVREESYDGTGWFLSGHRPGARRVLVTN